MFDVFKRGNEEILTASSSPNDSNCCQSPRAEGSVSISASPIEEKHDGTPPNGPWKLVWVGNTATRLPPYDG